MGTLFAVAEFLSLHFFIYHILAVNSKTGPAWKKRARDHHTAVIHIRGWLDTDKVASNRLLPSTDKKAMISIFLYIEMHIISAIELSFVLA